MPPTARALRARCVILKRGDSMDWHSNLSREELLMAITGRVDVEVQVSARRRRQRRLLAGQCAFLPAQTVHRVVNRSRTTATYLYVTGPIR